MSHGTGYVFRFAIRDTCLNDKYSQWKLCCKGKLDGRAVEIYTDSNHSITEANVSREEAERVSLRLLEWLERFPIKLKDLKQSNSQTPLHFICQILTRV